MTVASVTERIAQMSVQVSGVRTGFEQIPRIIMPAQCPAVVVFPATAIYDLASLGEQIVLERRSYEIVLFYADAAFGTGTQQQIGIEPMFNAIRDHFIARPGLTLDGLDPPQDVVYNAKITGDGGFQLVDYASGQDQLTTFAAIRFQMTVEETAQVLYKD